MGDPRGTFSELGRLLLNRATRDEGIALAREYIRRHEGNVCNIAHAIGISRRRVYYMLDTHDLWDALDDARAHRSDYLDHENTDPEWLVQSRLALAPHDPEHDP